MRRAIICYMILTMFTLGAVSCKKEPAVSGSEVRAVYRAQLPSVLDDKIWREAPVHPAKMILQDIVEPRLLQASTLLVKVQSVTDDRKIAFRLQWEDAVKNDLPGPARFVDACAVQLPAKVEAELPAPQMGEENKPVEITYWTAGWQAIVDGRPDTVQSIFPNASVDHYPSEATPLQQGSPEQHAVEKRYAPARALGNDLSGPRKQPVQDLLAEGPGTLRPADKQESTGTGRYGKTGWEVLIVRPLPVAGGQARLRSQVAFAVWEGSKQEVGSRKMRTAWIPLSLEVKK